MWTHSAIRLGALCGMLAGAACLTGPAQAQYLVNPGLDAVGPDGSTVTTTAPAVVPPYAGGPSAAEGWSQFVVWPGGTLTTDLEPTTDPSGSGNMLHIVTDSGDYPPAEQGNGWAQRFIGGVRLADATVTTTSMSFRARCTGGSWRMTPFSRIRRTFLARQTDGSK